MLPNFINEDVSELGYAAMCKSDLTFELNKINEFRMIVRRDIRLKDLNDFRTRLLEHCDMHENAVRSYLVNQ